MGTEGNHDHEGGYREPSEHRAPSPRLPPHGPPSPLVLGRRTPGYPLALVMPPTAVAVGSARGLVAASHLPRC